MGIKGLCLKLFMFWKERCLSGEEKRNSSWTVQPLKVVVLCLSAARDIGAAPTELFFKPSWSLGPERSLLGIPKSHSICDPYILNQPMEQLTLPC